MPSPDAPAFEEPLVELRRRIEELEGYPEGSGHEREIEKLRDRLEKSTREIYGRLTRWRAKWISNRPPIRWPARDV